MQVHYHLLISKHLIHESAIGNLWFWGIGENTLTQTPISDLLWNPRICLLIRWEKYSLGHWKCWLCTQRWRLPFCFSNVAKLSSCCFARIACPYWICGIQNPRLVVPYCKYQVTKQNKRILQLWKNLYEGYSNSSPKKKMIFRRKRVFIFVFIVLWLLGILYFTSDSGFLRSDPPKVYVKSS